MSLVKLDRSPSRRKLRQFGLAAAMLLPVVAWLSGGGSLLVAAAVLAVACGIAALAFPQLWKPAFVVLSLVTLPIGLVVGEFLMAGDLLPGGIAPGAGRSVPQSRPVAAETGSPGGLLLAGSPSGAAGSELLPPVVMPACFVTFRDGPTGVP